MKRNADRFAGRQSTDDLPNQLFHTELISIQRSMRHLRGPSDGQLDAGELHLFQRLLSTLFKFGHCVMQGSEQLLQPDHVRRGLGRLAMLVFRRSVPVFGEVRVWLRRLGKIGLRSCRSDPDIPRRFQECDGVTQHASDSGQASS